MSETVKDVATRLGTETAISWADHRIETLEAALASDRRTLYAVARAVRESPDMARVLAQQVDLLERARAGEEAQQTRLG